MMEPFSKNEKPQDRKRQVEQKTSDEGTEYHFI